MIPQISFELIRIGIGNAIFHHCCEIFLKQSQISFEYMSEDNGLEEYHIDICEISSIFHFNIDNEDSASTNAEDISYLVAIRASPTSSNRLTLMENHYISDTNFTNMANKEGRQAPRAYMTFEFIKAEDYESFVAHVNTIYKDKDNDVIVRGMNQAWLFVYAKAMIEDGNMSKNKRIKDLTDRRFPKDVPLFSYPCPLEEQKELLATKGLTEINLIFRPKANYLLDSSSKTLSPFSMPATLYEFDRRRLITFEQGQFLYLNDALIIFFI